MELQSLRGFAATIVLIHHCLRAVYPTPISAIVADRILDAQAAVVFFFVLSGYVLSASLSRRSIAIPESIAFYIRRIFRIYPAILIACLAVVIVLVAVPSPSGKLASVWIRSYHPEGVAPLGLIALSFLSVSMYLHPMLWTMFIELSASAFMPVIRSVQEHGTRWFFALVFGLSLLSFLVRNHTKLVSVYLVTFAVGAAVPYLSNIVAFVHRSRLTGLMSLIGAVLALFWFRELLPRDHWQSYEPLIVQIEALAAMWIVASVVHRPHGYPGLRRRALTWLGDISYGLYLLHFPILLIAVAAAERVFPSDVDRTALAFGIAATVYAVTVIVSAACYVVVELPAVAIGASLAQLMRRRFATAPALGKRW